MGITVSFVEDPDDPASWAAAVRPETKLFYGETISNPAGDVLDIEVVAGVAHEHGVPLVVDNTIATPYLIRPLEHGADIVVHSATKYLGGHGTTIAGAIVDSGRFDWAASGRFPGLTTADPSYHGVVFTDAVGPLAYLIKLRVQLLRDLGPAVAPSTRSSSPRGWRRCRCAWSGTSRTPGRSRTSSPSATTSCR